MSVSHLTAAARLPGSPRPHRLLLGAVLAGCIPTPELAESGADSGRPDGSDASAADDTQPEESDTVETTAEETETAETHTAETDTGETATEPVGDLWAFPTLVGTGGGFGSTLLALDIARDDGQELAIGAPTLSQGRTDGGGVWIVSLEAMAAGGPVDTAGPLLLADDGAAFGSELAAATNAGVGNLVIGAPGSSTVYVLRSLASLTAEVALAADVWGAGVSAFEPGGALVAACGACQAGAALWVAPEQGDDATVYVGAPDAVIESTKKGAITVGGFLRTTMGALAEGEGLDALLWYGMSDGDALGRRVSGSDLDGDGVLEAVMGVPGRGVGGGTPDDVGYFYLIETDDPGNEQQPIADVRDVHFRGEGEGDLVAGEIVGTDVDADGVTDFLVGAPGEGSRGGVFWLLGTALLEGTAILHCGSGSGQCGPLAEVAAAHYLAEPGDAAGGAHALAVLRRGGEPWLVVGAPGAAEERGAVYVARLVSGDFQLAEVSVRIEGSVAEGRAGAAVVPVDQDGDGEDDVLLVGAPGGDGAVYALGGAALDEILARAP